MSTAAHLNLSPRHLPPLQPGQAIVWWFDWTQVNLSPTQVQALLSPDERQRGDRFKFAQDRDRYCTSRAILRLLLGHYLACPPERVDFSYSAVGKPEVRSPQRNPKLRFNLSHAGPFSLYGLTLQHPIGVDLEQQRPLAQMAAILNRQFAPTVATQFHRLPSGEQDTYFFRLWTVTEAYLKATGEGLAGLSTIDLWQNAIAPWQQRVALSTHPTWETVLLNPSPGVIAAIALQHCQILHLCSPHLAQPILCNAPLDPSR
jgi:4'-phosphopantetheinyl transferase